MIRIGILGSDNSHSITFSSLFNIQGPRKRSLGLSDARVTHLFGLDDARNKEVAEAGEIPEIVKRPEDMLGNVDGVIVDFRHGSRHYKYARRFIEARVPTFVDKPFASKVSDCKKMIELAKKRRTPITTFSTVPLGIETAAHIQGLKKELGGIVGGVYSGPADQHSEYDGLIFYGIHTAEMMVAVHGVGVETVQAMESNNNIFATVRYKRGDIVSLNFMGNAAGRFQMLTYGKKDFRYYRADDATGSQQGALTVMNMIKTKKRPRKHDEMLEPIRVVEAVTKSLTTGKAVKLS